MRLEIGGKGLKSMGFEHFEARKRFSGRSCSGSCAPGTPRSRSVPLWASRRSSCGWRRRSSRSSCPRCRRPTMKRPFGADVEPFFEGFPSLLERLLEVFGGFSSFFIAFHGFLEVFHLLFYVLKAFLMLPDGLCPSRAPRTRTSRCAGAFWSSWTPCRRCRAPFRVHLEIYDICKYQYDICKYHNVLYSN